MKQLIRISILTVMMVLLGSALLFGQESAGSQVAGGTESAADTAAGGSSEEGSGPSEYLSFSVQAQLLVIDREAAAEALVEWVERQRGYFIEKSLQSVVLKVPVEDFHKLRTIVQDEADEVVTYDVNAYDLRQELNSVEAALASREENLRRVLVFLDNTDVAGTLALEREISSLMREIESLKGRERVLRNRMAYAEAYIQLTSMGTDIPSKRPSSFPWINTIDLYSFLEEQP